MSRIETTIFYIMKTSHNLNHVIYAMHAIVLLLNCCYWAAVGLLMGYYCVTAGLLYALCFILHALCSLLD